MVTRYGSVSTFGPRSHRTSLMGTREGRKREWQAQWQEAGPDDRFGVIWHSLGSFATEREARSRIASAKLYQRSLRPKGHKAGARHRRYRVVAIRS